MSAQYHKGVPFVKLTNTFFGMRVPFSYGRHVADIDFAGLLGYRHALHGTETSSHPAISLLLFVALDLG
jgi:hypothetical protein